MRFFCEDEEQQEEEQQEEEEGMHGLRWCANNDIIQPTSVFVLRVICWYLHDRDDFALLPNRYMYQLAWPGTPHFSFRLLPLVTRHQRAGMPTAVVNDRVHYLLNSQANPVLCCSSEARWSFSFTVRGTETDPSQVCRLARAEIPDMLSVNIYALCVSFWGMVLFSYETGHIWYGSMLINRDGFLNVDSNTDVLF